MVTNDTESYQFYVQQTEPHNSILDGREKSKRKLKLFDTTSPFIQHLLKDSTSKDSTRNQQSLRSKERKPKQIISHQDPDNKDSKLSNIK